MKSTIPQVFSTWQYYANKQNLKLTYTENQPPQTQQLISSLTFPQSIKWQPSDSTFPECISYQWTQKKRQKEWEIIQTMAKNNNFPQGLLQKLNQQIQHNTRCKQIKEKDKKICTTFMYHTPKIRKITNLFQNTNKGIAFKTTTTLQQLIKTKTSDRTTQHKKGEYIKSYATHVRTHMQDKLVTTSNRDSENTSVTLKIMTYTLHMLYTYLTADMNMATLTIP